MRLVTYQREGQTRTGAQLDGHVVDLGRAYQALLVKSSNDDELAVADARLPADMGALLAGGDASLQAAQQAVAFVRDGLASDDSVLEQQGIIYAAEQVTLLAPVLRPGKIVCVGLNYHAHAAETGKQVPDVPLLFHKAATSLVGHGQHIVLPRISKQVDYEAELAVVIGKRARYASEQDALSCVAGYTVANDVSARDLQYRTLQWTQGKMIDTFCPLGPAIVTRDEVPDPNALGIRSSLNGDVMQDSNTADMIFSVAFAISYISQIATLEAGDVILTGTPPGVGSARDPQIFLKPGDTVTIEIEKLGTLTNSVVDEKKGRLCYNPRRYL